MLPIVLDPARLRLAMVCGAEAQAAVDRLALFDAILPRPAAAALAVYASAPVEGLFAAAGARLVERLPVADDLRGLQIVFAMGLSVAQAQSVADAARLAGALINVEDRPELCDFHMPAVVRRGDLQIAVSTGGNAPGLARHIRHHLEQLFPLKWGARMDEVAERRRRWRTEGADRDSIGRWTRELVDRRGWLHAP